MDPFLRRRTNTGVPDNLQIPILPLYCYITPTLPPFLKICCNGMAFFWVAVNKLKKGLGFKVQALGFRV